MISFTILVALLFVGAGYKTSTTSWLNGRGEWEYLTGIFGLILFGMLAYFCFNYLP